MFLFDLNCWTDSDVFRSHQETRLHRKKLFYKTGRGEAREGKTKKKMGAGHERLVGEEHRGSREKNDGQGNVSRGHPGSNVSRWTKDKDELHTASVPHS